MLKKNFSSGETVTKDEQINLNDVDETLSTTQSISCLYQLLLHQYLVQHSSVVAAVATGIPIGGLDVRSVNADEWEKERTALYQQLDEKVIRKSELFANNF